MVDGDTNLEEGERGDISEEIAAERTDSELRIAEQSSCEEILPGEVDVLIARGEISLTHVRPQLEVLETVRNGDLLSPRKSRWMCLTSLDFLVEEGDS